MLPMTRLQNSMSPTPGQRDPSRADQPGRNQTSAPPTPGMMESTVMTVPQNVGPVDADDKERQPAEDALHQPDEHGALQGRARHRHEVAEQALLSSSASGR